MEIKTVRYYDWITENEKEIQIDVEKEMRNCRRGIHKWVKETQIGSTIWFRCLVCNKVIKETVKQDDWRD